MVAVAAAPDGLGGPDGFGGPEVFFCFFYSINRGGHKTVSKNAALTVT